VIFVLKNQIELQRVFNRGVMEILSGVDTEKANSLYQEILDKSHLTIEDLLGEEGEKQ